MFHLGGGKALTLKGVGRRYESWSLRSVPQKDSRAVVGKSSRTELAGPTAGDSDLVSANHVR